MSDEIKYCKFCNKEKPIKEFVKSGFAIKNICRECQNKKQAQIYRDSKRIKKLEQENQELKKQLEEHNLAIENLAYWKGKNESKMKINRLRRENQELKEQLEASEKARKEAIDLIEKLRFEKWAITGTDIIEVMDILNIDKQIDKYAEKINDDPRYDDLEPIEFREHINHVKEQMMKDIDKGE